MKKRLLALVLAVSVAASSAVSGEMSQTALAAELSQTDDPGATEHVETVQSTERNDATEAVENPELTENTETAESTETGGKAEMSGDAEAKEGSECTEDTEMDESTEANGSGAADGTDRFPTGLLPIQEADAGIILPGQVFYNTEAILESETAYYGSGIYNNEWDKYSTNYYYNQMDGEERAIWDAFDLMCLNYLTGTQDAEKVSGYDSEYAMEFIACGTDYNKARAAAKMFRYSNPQYYFLSTTLWRATDGEGNYFLAFGIYPAFADGDDRAVETAKVKSQAEQWLETATSYGTEEEKVRAIHDTIAQNVEYDDDFMNLSESEQSAYEVTAYTQSVYSVLCRDLTVCAGYAQTFEMLCNAAGVDCITVTSQAHQWNKVRVNDSWYNVDVTWADQSSYISYQYFARSDAAYDSDSAVNAANHAEESYWMEYLPVCSLDTGSASGAAGTFPVITDTTDTPVITVTDCGTEYQVQMTCATPGAVIYYTINGEEPSPAATKAFKYTDVFTMDSSQSIYAMAVCDAHWDSAVTGDVVLHDQVKVQTYRIAYVLNGGQNSTKNPTTYSTETDTIVLENPTRSGYTFDGWYSDEGYRTRVAQIAAGSTGDVTLYAKWTAISYLVAFEGNGSTSGTMGTREIVYGSGGKLPANAFGRTGYGFSGWNTRADGSGTACADGADASGLTTLAGTTVTLYAQWNKTKYTITYKLNGGKNNSANPASYTVTTAAITLKDPTRTGYTFDGWYTDSKYKNKVTKIKKGSTGNITLYAKWTAHKYTISYNGNGSTSGSMKAVTGCKYGKSYTLKANAYKKTNYTFAGWNTKKDGTGKSYKNKAEVQNLTSKDGGKVTLYAQWKKKKYTVTYKLNGGKNNSKNPSYYYKTSSTITLKKPARKGYTFAGWYTDSKYKKKITQIKKGSTGNLTLYAKWKKTKYTVTYRLNKGKNNSKNPNVYYVTTSTITLKKPTRKGYTFVGWYTDSKYRNKITQIKKGSTGNLTLYAKWKKK